MTTTTNPTRVTSSPSVSTLTKSCSLATSRRTKSACSTNSRPRRSTSSTITTSRSLLSITTAAAPTNKFLRLRAIPRPNRPISATARCSNRPLRPHHRPLPTRHNTTITTNHTIITITINRRNSRSWNRTRCSTLLTLTPIGTASSTNSINRHHRWFRRCTPSRHRSSHPRTYWPPPNSSSSSNHRLVSLARPVRIITICHRLR